MKKVKVSRKFYVNLMRKQYKLDDTKREVKAKIRKSYLNRLKESLQNDLNFYFAAGTVFGLAGLSIFKNSVKNIQLYNFDKFITIGIASASVLHNTIYYLMYTKSEELKPLKNELRCINKSLKLSKIMEKKIVMR